MRGRVSQPARAPGFDCMPDLLVIGGHGRERDSALVQSFSAAERRWRTEVCPHAPARACASFSASLCKPLRARARANLPVPCQLACGFRRDCAAAAELGGRVYVLGGTEGIAPLDQVESFDAQTGTWTLEPPLPFSRCAVAPHRPASGGMPPRPRPERL
jgi:hypothetical protein